MSYTYELENDQQLVIENEGGKTLVSLSSGSESQQQSQELGLKVDKPFSVSVRNLHGGRQEGVCVVDIA
jgi:hypothetical protein